MAITQEVIVLNEAPDFRERRRTTSAGTTSRYTIEVRSEPVLHVFSGDRMGADVAEAIAAQLRHEIKSITARVSPGAAKMRRKLERAFATGQAYALRRFSGGRTGAKPPKESDQLFNHSGRLADGIFVRQNVHGKAEENSFTVNVPANRLNPRDFKQEDFTRMLNQLADHVPSIRNPENLLKQPEVREAIRESIRNMIQVQSNRLASLKARRAAAFLNLLGFNNVAALVGALPAQRTVALDSGPG